MSPWVGVDHLLHGRLNEARQQVVTIRRQKAIESRIATAPRHYGEPLRKTLKGYRPACGRTGQYIRPSFVSAVTSRS